MYFESKYIVILTITNYRHRNAERNVWPQACRTFNLTSQWSDRANKRWGSSKKNNLMSHLSYIFTVKLMLMWCPVELSYTTERLMKTITTNRGSSAAFRTSPWGVGGTLTREGEVCRWAEHDENGLQLVYTNEFCHHTEGISQAN